MIRFTPRPEPPEFDSRVRTPGIAWLAAHPRATRPRPFWSILLVELASAFDGLCAYSVMWEPIGTVDHFRPFAGNPELAYEWTNYRFASHWINSKKGDREVLDPFEVGENWFEILLPSLQLVATEHVPEEIRELVEQTLDRLGLRDDERIIRQRRAWYSLWESGELSLAGLRARAPLLARALARGSTLPEPRTRESSSGEAN